MRIQSITFRNFRNYPSYSLETDGNLTIFVGNNGVGKTNILEGIQLLTSASSFRNPQVSQLVLEGEGSGKAEAELSDGNRSIAVQLSLEPGKKRYLVNGKPKGAADVRGNLPAVTFTPDDLQLAKKSSSVKRDALDNIGVQLTRNYYIVRRDFEKTLRYKNRLLKDGASRPLIESIDETLITCASQLFCFRRALFERLMPLVSRNYRSIAGTPAGQASPESPSGEAGGFAARYLPSWNHLDPASALWPAPGEDAPRDEVRARLAEALQAHAPEEERRARSLVGPHNDKVEFLLDGRDASSFASQGQQRSIVLAWKLAEVELVRQSTGTNPVLLLDDVMSELDATRRDMLVRFVTDDIQTFMTATDLSNFNEALLDRAQIVPLGQQARKIHPI